MTNEEIGTELRIKIPAYSSTNRRMALKIFREIYTRMPLWKKIIYKIVSIIHCFFLMMLVKIIESEVRKYLELDKED